MSELDSVLPEGSLAKVFLSTLILAAIGVALKRAAWFSNNHIPLVMGLLGAGVYPVFTQWTAANALIGVWVGLGAVGVHSVISRALPATLREPKPKPPAKKKASSHHQPKTKDDPSLSKFEILTF